MVGQDALLEPLGGALLQEPAGLDVALVGERDAARDVVDVSAAVAVLDDRDGVVGIELGGEGEIYPGAFGDQRRRLRIGRIGAASTGSDGTRAGAAEGRPNVAASVSMCSAGMGRENR